MSKIFDHFRSTSLLISQKNRNIVMSLMRKDRLDPRLYLRYNHLSFNTCTCLHPLLTDIEHAIQTWKIVLAGRFNLLEDWCTFLAVSYLCDPNMSET